MRGLGKAGVIYDVLLEFIGGKKQEESPVNNHHLWGWLFTENRAFQLLRVNRTLPPSPKARSTILLVIKDG
jgi:hypothetical protein